MIGAEKFSKQMVEESSKTWTSITTLQEHEEFQKSFPGALLQNKIVERERERAKNNKRLNKN